MRDRGGIHRLFFYASHPHPPCGQQCVELAASDVRQCHLSELHQPVGHALHDQWPLWRHGTVYVVLLLYLGHATEVIIQVLRSTLTLSSSRHCVPLCVLVCSCLPSSDELLSQLLYRAVWRPVCLPRVIQLLLWPLWPWQLYPVCGRRTTPTGSSNCVPPYSPTCAFQITTALAITTPAPSTSSTPTRP